MMLGVAQLNVGLRFLLEVAGVAGCRIRRESGSAAPDRGGPKKSRTGQARLFRCPAT